MKALKSVDAELLKSGITPIVTEPWQTIGRAQRFYMRYMMNGKQVILVTAAHTTAEWLVEILQPVTKFSVEVK